MADGSKTKAHDVGNDHVQTPLFERTATLVNVIDQRVKVYGEVVPSFERIAQVWSGILGSPVSATDVPLMLIGMKTVRAQITPDYSDNSDDIDGYLDIFRKLVGDDMVKARLVDEYILEKNARG
jgi:hypothetical protein